MSWAAAVPATAIDVVMEESSVSARPLGAASKDLARRLLTIGENRLELLSVEMQEERDRVLRAILLALGVAAFGLLAGMTLTAAIVVVLWDYPHVVVLLALTGLYGLAGICLYRWLTRSLRDRETLSATLDQLQKDRACLEKILA
jgi:uncharacterized membrane protein YqjE